MVVEPNGSEDITLPAQLSNSGRQTDGVHVSRGKLLGAGVSGIVELSNTGYAIKSPWPGLDAEGCKQDLITEARIYQRLGEHHRIVKMHKWNPESFTITLEYMPNGCLHEYMQQNNESIRLERRVQWALDVAEGLRHLHASDVIHCDLKPKNLLLDAELRLKLADFSGSSLQGSEPSGCAGVRYMPRGSPHTFGVQADLFALGSTIYKIMTGSDPYEELDSPQVSMLYKMTQFPDLSSVAYREVIRRCWSGEVSSAKDAYDLIRVNQNN